MRKGVPVNANSVVVAAIALYFFAGDLSAQAIAVSLLDCNPTRLLRGETATCTVTLSKAAPDGGTEILLSSTSRFLATSANSVTVPAGATTATFTVTAAAFSVNETATLTATALHSVLLSWNASESPTLSYYNLYRGTVSGGPYPVVTAVGLVTSYIDSNVQAGESYYYVVTAVDTSGAESAYSNEAVAILPNGVPQNAVLSLCASERTSVIVPLRCGAIPIGTAQGAN
jgi:hypothetical protein